MSRKYISFPVLEQKGFGTSFHLIRCWPGTLVRSSMNVLEISIALETAVHVFSGYSLVFIILLFFLNHAREFVFHGTDHRLSEVEREVTEPFSRRSDFIDRFTKIANLIDLKLEKSYARNKKYYDAHRSTAIFEEGDLVYLRNYVKSDAAKAFSKKLAPKYVPGKVKEKISPIAFQIVDLDGKSLGKWHVQDMKKAPPTIVNTH